MKNPALIDFATAELLVSATSNPKEAGEDIYKRIAATMFGVTLAEVTEDQRQFAKVSGLRRMYRGKDNAQG